MRYLLDTHAWLWLLLEPKRIGPKMRKAATSKGNEFHLSIASAWEIAIKHAAGRLALPEPPFKYVQSRTREDGVGLLAVRLEHVCAAAALPRHHADPFDRLLVAQAQHDELVLVTHDDHIKLYDLKTIDPAR